MAPKLSRRDDEKSHLLKGHPHDNTGLKYVDVELSPINTASFMSFGLSHTDSLRLVDEDDTDNVGKWIRNLRNYWLKTLLCWISAYHLILLTYIEPTWSKHHFKLFESIGTILMLTGSLVGITAVILCWKNLCGNLRLVTKERIILTKGQGLKLSATLGDFVEVESLPLLRKLLFCCFVAGVFLALSIISEIFFILWIIKGMIGMWHSFIPLIIILAIILVSFYIVRIISAYTFVSLALAYLDAVSSSLRHLP